MSQFTLRHASPSRTPADVGVAVATAVGLIAWNNLVAARPWHAHHYVFANLVGTSDLLTLARLRGLTAGELGLSSQRVAAGARTGAAVGAPIMVLWAGVALSPHRARLRDGRLAGMSARQQLRRNDRRRRSRRAPFRTDDTAGHLRAAALPLEVVSGDTILGMAMTLRLSEADDRLLTARARSEGRSKQEVAREAIHAYLTDQVRRVEDLEDELAIARYQLRKQLGEVTYVSHAEARSSLGLPPAPRRSATA